MYVLSLDGIIPGRINAIPMLAMENPDRVEFTTDSDIDDCFVAPDDEGLLS